MRPRRPRWHRLPLHGTAALAAWLAVLALASTAAGITRDMPGGHHSPPAASAPRAPSDPPV